MLGRRGLGLESGLVDNLCIYPGSYCRGIPQGPPLSDLLARLILTVFDRFAQDIRLPYSRFSDDILLFGESKKQLDQRLDQVARFLVDIGFVPNPRKIAIEPPGRINWVKQLIFWGDVPIEEYQSDYLEVSDALTPRLSGDEEGNRAKAWTNQVDWIQIYLDESSPGRPARSESGHKRTLYEIGRRYPDLIKSDCKALVQDRANNIRSIFAGLNSESETAIHVAGTAYQAVKRSKSTKDDHIHIARKAPRRQSQDMARRTLVHENPLRSTKQGMIDLLERSELAILTAMEHRSRSPWIDEHAALALILGETGGMSAKVARASLLSSYPEVGLIYEAVESTMS